MARLYVLTTIKNFTTNYLSSLNIPNTNSFLLRRNVSAMRSVSIFYLVVVLCAWRWGGASGGASSLVSKLRNDMNLDLSADDEYEDLRAELLAYHTAFASLAAAERGDTVGPDEGARRSLGSTPCWNLGGICVHKDLCAAGNRYLTEVAGCRGKLQVCCFNWNQYKMKDMTAFGINNGAYPWSHHQGFGLEGMELPDDSDKDDNKSGQKENHQPPDIKPGSGDEKEDEKHKVDIDEFLKTGEDDANVQQEDASIPSFEQPEKGKARLRKRKHKKPARPLAIIIKT